MRRGEGDLSQSASVARKSTIFTAGDRPPPVIETRFGRLAVMICYDLEFPEWVRLPALAGAQLLCAPVNWPLAPRPQGERPAEMVKAQANAAVNRLFIAVCDRCETERGVAWIGGSVIVDADGYPLTQSLTGEGMVLASMDIGAADDSTSAATITCIAIGGRCCIEAAGRAAPQRFAGGNSRRSGAYSQPDFFSF